MGQARIISIKRDNTSRNWKIAGAVAAAFTTAAYFWIGDGAQPGDRVKIGADVKQKLDPAELVASQKVETAARKSSSLPGAPGSTDDMWGLLQRAENVAEQARHEADIEYSKSLDAESCATFWVAHANYQRMREASDPIHKMQYFGLMTLRAGEFLSARDFEPVARNGYQGNSYEEVSDSWRAAKAALLAPAMREMERRLRQNPDDPDLQQEYAHARMQATHYRLNIPHQLLDKQGYEEIIQKWDIPRRRMAVEAISAGALPADLTGIEAEKYVSYAYITRSLNSQAPESIKTREALGLTQQQADIIATTAQNIIDEQLRQHVVKMREHMRRHNAPCEYN